MKIELPDYVFCMLMVVMPAATLKAKIKPADISLNGMHSNALRVSGVNSTDPLERSAVDHVSVSPGFDTLTLTLIYE